MEKVYIILKKKEDTNKVVEQLKKLGGKRKGNYNDSLPNDIFWISEDGVINNARNIKLLIKTLNDLGYNEIKPKNNIVIIDNQQKIKYILTGLLLFLGLLFLGGLNINNNNITFDNPENIIVYLVVTLGCLLINRKKYDKKVQKETRNH